jgi:beta-lactamase class A
MSGSPAPLTPLLKRCAAVLVLGTVVMAGSMRAIADSDLAARVSALTAPFKGSVMLYAKNLRTGRDFAIGGDTKVRTASTIKLPILCALESLVAARKVRWDERLVLKPDDKVTGSASSATLPMARI